MKAEEGEETEEKEDRSDGVNWFLFSLRPTSLLFQLGTSDGVVNWFLFSLRPTSLPFQLGTSDGVVNWFLFSLRPTNLPFQLGTSDGVVNWFLFSLRPTSLPFQLGTSDGVVKWFSFFFTPNKRKRAETFLNAHINSLVYTPLRLRELCSPVCNEQLCNLSGTELPKYVQRPIMSFVKGSGSKRRQARW